MESNSEYIDSRGFEYLIELLEKEKANGKSVNSNINIIEFLKTFSHLYFLNMNIPLLNKSSLTYLLNNIEMRREEA